MYRYISHIISLLVAILLFSVTIDLKAQDQGKRFYNWHFGYKWALNFESSPPTLSRNTSMMQFEGCASISDYFGNLIMYTNGQVLYNSDHEPVIRGNGLNAHPSSTMAALITPYIGDRDKYYVFTVDGMTCEKFDGLNYNVVDMAANQRKGEILPNKKNVVLTDSVAERVVALPGENRFEYWVVTQKIYTDSFYAYKVDCNGINPKPVKSSTGSMANNYGFMKPSHKGDKIFGAQYIPSRSFEMFDFNNKTGKVSNAKVISHQIGWLYSLAISPNDSLIYVAEYKSTELRQYQVHASNPRSTEKLVIDEPPGVYVPILSLEMAPDGNLYIKREKRLDVLHNPNDTSNFAMNLEYFFVELPGPYRMLNPATNTTEPSLNFPNEYEHWPLPLTIPDTTICPGDSVRVGFDSMPNLNYSWSPAKGLSDPHAANPVASPDSTTIYSVAVSGNSQCTEYATVKVTIKDKIDLYSSDTLEVFKCPGEVHKFELKNYVNTDWFQDGIQIPGEHGDSLVVEDEGVYSANIYLKCNITDTFNAEVKHPAPPAIDVYPKDTLRICPRNYTGILAKGGKIVSWKSNDSLLPDTTNLLPISLPGKYTAIIEDSCGRQDTGVINVAAKPFPNIIFNVADSILFCQVEDTILAASGGKVINWKRNGNIIKGAKDSFIHITKGGTYEVTMQHHTSGCSSSESIYIEMLNGQSNLINVQADTLCKGEKISLLAMHKGSYLWQPDSLFNCKSCRQVTISPTENTEVYFTFSPNNSPCVLRDTSYLMVVEQITKKTTGDTTICPDDQIQLHAYGGDSVAWEPNQNLSCFDCRTPIVSPGQSQIYGIQYFTKMGCVEADSVQVTVAVPPQNPVTADDIVMCKGDTASLNATNGKNYNWYPSDFMEGANEPDPKVFPPNSITYYLDVTYGPQAKCMVTDSVRIKVDPLAGNLPSDTTVCQGNQMVLSAEGFDQYHWHSSIDLSCNSCASVSFTPADTVDIHLTVTTQSGCTKEQSITVNTRPAPDFNISGPSSICREDTANFDVTGIAQYQWMPDSLIIQSTGQTSPIQTTTFTVNGTSANGCQKSKTKTLQVNQLPNVQAMADTTICQGQQANLMAMGAENYLWQSTGSINCINCSNITISPTNTTTFTLTGTDGNECRNTDSAQVSVIPKPLLTTSADTAICKGEAVDIQAFSNAPLRWKSFYNLPCDTCHQIKVTPSKSSIFTITATGKNNCQTQDSIQVEVIKPRIQVSNDTTICPGDEVKIKATGAADYKWLPGFYDEDAIKAFPQSPTTFTVIGITNRGCRDTAYASVAFHDTIHPKIMGDSLFCKGEQVKWKVFNGTSVKWMPMEKEGNLIQFTAKQNQPVTALIIDSNNCKYTRTKKLSVYPNQLTVETPIKTYKYKKVQLNASGIKNYHWQPAQRLSNTNIAHPVFQSMETGQFVYMVHGSTSHGCNDTANVKVIVDPIPSIHLPNAFTPNNDGRNDYLEYYFPEEFELIQLSIYNRWGTQVFKTHQTNEFWNGETNGQPAPYGTYVVVIKYIDHQGQINKQTGNITIIR